MALTREQELKKAIESARLPPRDLTVLRALFKRADWTTAIIPNRFQPRSHEDLAGPGLSVRSVQRALDHLVMHGWVTRQPRKSPGRQGRAIAYGVEFGKDCDCEPDRPPPMTGAERARRWREKQRQIGVTQTGIQRQIGVTYNATPRYEDAGQGPVSAEEGREEGEWKWGWPEDSVGAEVNQARG